MGASVVHFEVISKDPDGMPVLTVYNERTVNIFDRFLDMLNSEAAPIRGEAAWGNPNSVAVFRDGRSLFADVGMGDIVKHRDMEDEIGILPSPKYDESTPKYFAPVEAYARMMIVPITATDLERTSIIVEALAAEGYRTIIPTYYEISLKTKHARDDESADMLDFIRDGGVYDFGYLNMDLTGDLAIPGAILVTRRNLNFPTLYERNEVRVQTRIQNLIEENR